MREVDITDAELQAKARNGADLSKEEKARLAQISGETEADAAPPTGFYRGINGRLYPNQEEPAPAVKAATEPKPKRAYRKRQS